MSSGSAWRALDLVVAVAAGLTLGLLLAAILRRPESTDPPPPEGEPS